MAAAAILYVGDDRCHRIPVMESSGLVVVHSECSVGGVRSLLAKDDGFSAISFHNDRYRPSDAVVSAAREISGASLILFRNPTVECDERVFDVVIPALTAPDVWSKFLLEAIEEARKIREHSRQLRQDCAAARDWTRSLREIAARNQLSPFDYDGLFRPGVEGMAEESDDEGDAC